MLTALGIVGVLTLGALSLFASAQSGYPDKPIHMIIPLAPASTVDNAARIVAHSAYRSTWDNRS